MFKIEETSSDVAMAYWQAFGFDTFVDPDSNVVGAVLPTGVVGLLASGPKQVEALHAALRKIAIPPGIWANVSKVSKLALFALEGDPTVTEISEHFDGICRVYSEGDPVQLPSGEFLNTGNHLANTIDELSVLDSLEEQKPPSNSESADDLPMQVSGGTLLDQFSLLGTGAELEASTAKSVLLLGRCILSGQATVIYSPPNTGKTLITIYLLCVASLTGGLNPAKCYYINADDSQQGLAEKTAILDEAGINTLAPGLRGFTTTKLAPIMTEMIEQDSCDGVVIIVDTLKKFVDLMDKKQSANLGDTVRQFVLKGGTFLALAHTRKNEGSNGEIVYGGTSDIMEDFDAACLLVPLPNRTLNNEKLVQFQFKKRRGNNVDEFYAYDDEPDCSYAERFASVRHVEGDEQDKYAAAYNQRTDQQLIGSIRACIGTGEMQKMALVRMVAEKTGVSRQAATKVLERYTGDDPDKHHWSFAVRARGAKVYSVHPAGDT